MKKNIKNKRKSSYVSKKNKKLRDVLVKKEKQKTPTQELFSTLSLSAQDEHELLQSLFISALKRGFRNDKKNSVNPDPFLSEKYILQSNKKDTKAGFDKAEEKITRVLKSPDSDEDDEKKILESNGLSNLKYAQPKYKNVESVLKYVETPDDKGIVKLVIMNFND